MQGVQPLIWDNRHFLYSGQKQDIIENVWTHTLPIVNSILIRITAVTRGHFLGWSTDQDFHIGVLIWQTRFTKTAIS